VNFWGTNAWINYTRTYPTGNYYVYARLAGGNGPFGLQLASVTSGWGTGTQTTNYIGTFVSSNGPSFGTWQYVPLVNTNTGQPIALSLGGTNTFTMTADGNEDANFFMLVSVTPPSPNLAIALSGTNVLLSFPTQTGFNYTVSYRNNLTDLTWNPLGSAIPGDGTTKTVTNSITGSPHQFYRLGVQ
jgi:hypothetical protein